MKESSNVFVNKTNIDSSDYYLERFKLGRNFGKGKNQDTFCINGV